VALTAAAKAVEDLKSEIKLLHWHKLANDAALKVTQADKGVDIW
jgi:hypothetical protein